MKKIRIISAFTVLLLLLSVMPFAASAESNVLVLDTPVTVTVPEGQTVEFEFTPEVTGGYSFIATGVEDDYDPVGYIYEGGTQLTYNDDTNGRLFDAQAKLTAGVRYTMKVRGWNDHGGVVTVKVYIPPIATSMRAFDMDKITMEIGHTLYSYVEFLPEGAYREKITYSASKPDLFVRLDSDSIVPIKAGTATITATSEQGLKDTVKVTVSAPAVIKENGSVKISRYNPVAKTYAFKAEKTQRYAVIIEDCIGVDAHVIDKTGNVMANYYRSSKDLSIFFDAIKGETYYIIMDHYNPSDVEATYTLSVKKAISTDNVTVAEKEYIAYVNDMFLPQIDFSPLNGEANTYIDSVTFSNDTVAQWDEDNHEISCIGVGSVQATAHIGEKNLTFKVTVKEPTAITAAGRYSFTPSAKQKEFEFDFTPTKSGEYHIYLLQEGVYYYVDADEGENGYLMTAGDTYRISVESDDYSFGVKQTLVIIHDDDYSCKNDTHKWTVNKGFSATTLTYGVYETVCTKCGLESYDEEEIVAPKKVATYKQFTDVKKGAWYYKAVDFAYGSDLFQGTEKTVFSPNAPMTRAMFVTVLGRMTGISVSKNVTTKFKDVAKGQWYTGYVKWAAEAGIVNGKSPTTFEPNANITREELCVMMERYLKANEWGLRNDFASVTFKDASKISKWAKSAVLACQKGGIIGGKPSGNGVIFDPQGQATRAEVATILHNFVNNYLLHIFAPTAW